jgi:hypothetical protein
MPPWEYLKLDLNSTPRRGDSIDALNKAGTDGWELVAVTGNGIATLKREIAQLAKAGRRKVVAQVAG